MQAAIAKYGKQIDAVLSMHGLQTPGSIEAFVEAGYKAGEIPPHTSADVNGALQMAPKYKVPDLEVGYPPLWVACHRIGPEVLQVVRSCITQINAQIGLTHGDENALHPASRSLRGPRWSSRGPADMLITGGMGRAQPQDLQGRLSAIGQADDSPAHPSPGSPASFP